MEKTHSFTVTTLNSHFGQAVATPEDCEALAGSDIVLLQEVINQQQAQLNKNLGSVGLQLVSFNRNAGLAIAATERFVPVYRKYHLIQSKSSLAKFAKDTPLTKHFRERGLLIANLKDTETGNAVTVATDHPTVAIRHFSRRNQVNAVTRALQHYAVGPLILGGDQNHYP